MAPVISMCILIVLCIFGYILLGINGSTEVNQGLKAETFESRRSRSPSISAENGAINPDLIPEECRKMGICEEIPVGLEFDDIISSIDKSEKDKYVVKEHQIDHEHRIGENNTLTLCEARNKTVKPSFATALDGLWYRIFNSANETIQTYNEVVCVNNDQPCRTIDNFLGYHLDKMPICKQNFIWRRMAYIGKGKKIYYDKTFKIPISCTCKKYL